ncbi:MAG: hypothetical protein HY858_05360 [Candidatus Solibacter usitatus]|nr:hypothetical protein [Candidatus Solibacter usitatus]
MRKVVVLLGLAGAMCWGQDPLKVAGGTYRLIAENDEVRLLEGNLPVGAKTAMHTHPALMAVMLEAGLTKWTMPDGKSVQSAPEMKRGSVVAMGPQSHISQNMDKKALKVLLVEFKRPVPAAGKAKKASSARSCKVVAESEYATAQLCSGAAGSVVEKHTHAGSAVYVALTDVNAELTDSAGAVKTLTMKRDAASIAPAVTHSGKNMGKAYELIVVDLK